VTTLSYAVRDSATMFRRDLTHAVRFPMVTLSGIGLPVFFLLLFVGVFGNTLRAGLGDAVAAGGSYIDYLVPGILVMTAAACAETTAVMVLLVLVAVALGFRPTAAPLEWLAASGVFVLLAVAVTWLTVAFGLFAKTPAGANSLSLLIVVLPFVSSAFVPTGSMPAGARWFAENQPFTHVIETFRGLLTGTAVGSSAVLSVGWCAAIAVVGYLWAKYGYDRNRPTA
jgi:ABC-2 type transport system permease protein